ncbi:MAG: Ppx/GppA family phosphatase [Deltaproteobacteria bacterium]|nr:MAG: Ppx/GppA family phosphatase [Deltaproteobacteria bacterium]
MRRLATLDVGSNSVTGLVAEARGARWVPVYEGTWITRLGRGLEPGQPLSPDGLAETLEAVDAFAARASALGADRLVGVATAAAREASDGARLVEGARVRGVELRIVSGEEEAELTWLAAWKEFGAAGEPLAVVDVGGRSTEVVWGRGPSPSYQVSLATGSVLLTERHIAADPPSPADREALQGEIERVARLVSLTAPLRRVVATAGTATTLASVWLALPRYDAQRIHGCTLTATQLSHLVDRLWSMPCSERARLPGMEPRRADVLPAGAALLRCLLRHLGASAVTVSDRGVRWGLLYRLAG